MADTILSSPFVVETLLPFLLVFTVLFAILQKSEILGKGKKQIDAIVSLVVGLLVVSFGGSSGIIVGLMPVLAVSLVVIIVFLILAGSVGFSAGDKVKTTVAIIAVIVVVAALLINTGAWTYIRDLFTGAGDNVITNIVFILVIGAAVAVVMASGGGSSGDKE